MGRDRERENPLPPDEWVELTTQLDTADDERYDLLAAGQRPYDDIEGQIGQRPNAFAARLPDRLVTYLDDRLQISQGAARAASAEGAQLPAPLMGPRPRPAEPALTLVAACRRLAVEEPALFACVVLCRLKGRSERVAAAELGIANSLVNKRKWQGVAQLVVWSGRSEGEVVAWLDGLRRLWTAREAALAAAAAAAADRTSTIGEVGA